MVGDLPAASGGPSCVAERRLPSAVPGVALGCDADAIAVRVNTPELLLRNGGHEAFPLEIAK